jgi:hypothetical protein
MKKMSKIWYYNFMHVHFWNEKSKNSNIQKVKFESEIIMTNTLTKKLQITNFSDFHDFCIIWLENNTKSCKRDFFGKVVVDLFLLLLFMYLIFHISISPFSLENFDPCNFSQGAKKVVFFQVFYVFYAAKNL